MKLTLAKPEHARPISEFYDAVHGGSDFAHEELYSAATVQQLLRDGELEIIVASSDRNILGCGLGFPQLWNQSLEIGALSVDAVPERAKVGKALFEAIRRVGMQKYGLVIFRASTEASFRRARNIGAQCWGYWPRPGARSLQDAEMIMGMFHEDGDTPRITPPDNAVTRLPFGSRLIDTYTRAEPGLPYPKNYPVGAPRGTGTPMISGRIWPTYHKRDNYITIENTAGRYPIEIIRGFVGKVREKGVSDIRLTLPVNQDQAFAELIDFGFKPVSYLPGWFLRGPYRYDCVEMVAGMPRLRSTDDNFAARAIRKIDEGMELL